MQNKNQQQIERIKENLKTKYKNQRLEEAKQIYVCECQKVYLSFAALYLHVRNKHNLKLTTKITDKICKMQSKNGKTYITYFLIPEQEIEQQKEDLFSSDQEKKLSRNEQIKTWNANLDNYLGHDSVCLSEEGDKVNVWQIQALVENYLREAASYDAFVYQQSAEILSHFLHYIKTCVRNSKQFDQFKNSFPQSFITSMPLFFNEFLGYYLPLRFQSSAHKLGGMTIQQQVMINFGNWMRQKQYTNLMIFTARWP